MAWAMIPEELVRRSWTACGYKSEQDLASSNEGAILVYDNREVGTMVEEICGADVRTNFEGAECGPDPFHPSDDECSSSDGDTESSDDDEEIEELYADPPPPARKAEKRTPPSARMAKERTPPPARMAEERTPPPRMAEKRTPPPVNDNMCAAGEHCGMKSVPLHEKAYLCLNCNNKMHGFLCGHLWSERGDDCQIPEEDLSEWGRKKCKSTGALICFACAGGK